MSAADFLDSNVLVYMFDRQDQAKQVVARRCVAEALSSGRGVISFQVVQETLNALTQKARQPLPAAEALELLHAVLVPLWRVQPSAGLYEHAQTVRQQQGFSFYDSLIVAAALEANCKRLITEDLQHGQKVGGLRIENPFRQAA